MTVATMELNMPDAITSGPGLWGTIAAGLTVVVAMLYTLWGNLRKNGAENDTETEALRMVGAAVEHWKGLYDVLQTQVLREREQREAAEQRAMLAINEVEGLRGEVAALKRQIDQLSATINKLTGAQV
jgi:hypothetical protein